MGKLRLRLARLDLAYLEDMEVIVRCVAARVTFGTQRRAENDQILRDTRVDEVHAPHGAAGVVEDPFVLVRRNAGLDRGFVGERARGDVLRAVGRTQRGDDVVDCGGCAVGVLRQSFLEENVHVFWVEDVEV